MIKTRISTNLIKGKINNFTRQLKNPGGQTDLSQIDFS